MTLDPLVLKAALLDLLRSKGRECGEECIQVSPLARDRPPQCYLITPATGSAQFLAGVLAHLTGRFILADQSAWVLLENEAESIVRHRQSASAAIRCR